MRIYEIAHNKSKRRRFFVVEGPLDDYPYLVGTLPGLPRLGGLHPANDKLYAHKAVVTPRDDGSYLVEFRYRSIHRVGYAPPGSFGVVKENRRETQ